MVGWLTSPHTHAHTLTHYIPVALLLFLDRTVNSGPQVAPKPAAKSRHWKKKSGQLHGCCRNYRSDQELRKKKTQLARTRSLVARLRAVTDEPTRDAATAAVVQEVTFDDL